MGYLREEGVQTGLAFGRTGPKERRMEDGGEEDAYGYYKQESWSLWT